MFSQLTGLASTHLIDYWLVLVLRNTLSFSWNTCI